MTYLIQDGKVTRSRIGVAIEDLQDDYDYKIIVPNLEEGVVIKQIMPDGPAAKSDLKAGDIVVAVDGKSVKTSRELKEEISYKKVGQVVTLDVARVDAANKVKNLKIKVKTDAIPTSTTVVQRDGTLGPERSSFGLFVRPLTKNLAEEHGLDIASGMLVTAVEAGSVAQAKGIQAGDVITEVNRTPVSTPKQFREAMNASDPKKGVIVNFVSKGTSRFTVLKED